MPRPGYAVARLNELPRLPAFGEPNIWRPVRHHFGIDAFGINAYTADQAGAPVIEEHDERSGAGPGGHQELYVVLEGEATFTLDSGRVRAPAGTFVFIEDPAIRRAAVASVTLTTVLAIGGQPGKAFEVSPWEYSFRALAVDPPEAFAIFDQGIARFPTNAGLRYNLACVYAREGQRDAALASLGQAIKLDTRALEWAAGDEDFASLRDDPEFRAAVAAR